MIKIISIVICLLSTITSISQTFEAKEKITKKVFSDLVYAYGNSKPSPKLTILKKNKNEGVGAIYKNVEEPEIIIDEQIIDICLELKSDSLNALATVLSHELAHYFNDHTFCAEYSFAMRKNSLGISLSKINKTNQIEKESQADYEGLIYAAIAGYYPFNTFEKIINRIYIVYKLPNTIPGYPSLIERKEINKERWKKVGTLTPLFEVGNSLLYFGQYENAALIFKYITQYFPSREIYNNLGIAQLLLGLRKKPKQAIDYIYPIEIDPYSRLQGNNTRSNITNSNEFTSIFESAKESFNKAILIDPNYIKSKINLACLYDIIGNYNMSIGIINELPDLYKNDKNTLSILGISYDHLGEKILAKNAFLKIGDSTNYNFVLNKLKEENFISAIKYQLEYKNENIPKIDSIDFNDKYIILNISKNEKFKIIENVENKFKVSYDVNNSQYKVLIKNKELLIKNIKILRAQSKLSLLNNLEYGKIIKLNDTVICKINKQSFEFIEIKYTK
jgi:tetratricopeptide (TPR) repeat protein